MSEDPLLIDYLLLLRFGSSEPDKSLRPLLNYASISRITKNEAWIKKASLSITRETRCFMRRTSLDR